MLLTLWHIEKLPANNNTEIAFNHVSMVQQCWELYIVTMVVSSLYQKAYDACRIAVGSRDHVIGLYTQSYSSTIDRMFPSLPDLSL